MPKWIHAGGFFHLLIVGPIQNRPSKRRPFLPKMNADAQLASKTVWVGSSPFHRLMGGCFKPRLLGQNRMWPREPRTLAAAHLDESKQMIIRRIRVMEPREEHTEHEENRRRAERSACNNSNPHGAQIKIVRSKRWGEWVKTA